MGIENAGFLPLPLTGVGGEMCPLSREARGGGRREKGGEKEEEKEEEE